MESKHLSATTFWGIFALCAGLLYFELFFVRILSFVGGAHSIYLTIAFAMLGLACASSIVAVLSRDHWLIRSPKSLASLCVMISWAIVGSVVAAYFIKELVNARELAAMDKGGFYELLLVSHDVAFISICALGLAASFTYFIFGLAISVLFRRSNREEFGKLYAYDLMGAFVGCVAVVWALESVEFNIAVLICVVCPILAGMLFSVKGKSEGSGIVLVHLALMPVAVWALGDWIEPKPLDSRIARDFNGTHEVVEDWRVWNSYGRISGITKTDAKGQSSQIVVHGNGEGHAAIPEDERPDLSVRFAEISSEPERVLVLLAGAGNDMARFATRFPNAEITGVELVGDVFEMPIQRGDGDVAELVALDNVKLIQGEAREYLARDDTKYDVILVSWSGASLSYFTGAASSAADFIYTKEALVALLDRLAPDGHLILLNGNKIRHILALKEIFAETVGYSSVKSSLIVSNDEGNDQLGFWWLPWDSQKLLVKPTGFSEEEVSKISSYQKILYAPHLETNEENWYRSAVLGNSSDLISEFISVRGVDLSVVTDDRPFILDTFPFSYYFSDVFWGEKLDYESWKLKKTHLQFVGVFSIFALVTILVPVVVKRKQSTLTARRKMTFTFYFALIGAGFMFFEIGLLSKLQLLIGHPGYVIAIVLSSIILFTGIGSMLSSRTERISWISTKSLALIAVVAMFATSGAFDFAKDIIVGFPFVVKCAIAFCLPCVPCLVMGHMFPLGMKALSAEDEEIVPWALAINGVSGTLASGMTIVVAQAFGYSSMLYLGCLCYLLLGILDLSKPEAAVGRSGPERQALGVSSVAAKI